VPFWALVDSASLLDISLPAHSTKALPMESTESNNMTILQDPVMNVCGWWSNPEVANWQHLLDGLFRPCKACHNTTLLWNISCFDVLQFSPSPPFLFGLSCVNVFRSTWARSESLPCAARSWKWFWNAIDLKQLYTLEWFCFGAIIWTKNHLCFMWFRSTLWSL